MKLKALAGLAAIICLAQAHEAQALTLVHSNDVMGDIEPCGCRGDPKGGMIRKANLLKSLPDSDLLQLDAGDLLFPTDSLPELLSNQSTIQATALLKAMELLHHDAIVPGEKDFALGFDAFEKLRKGTSIPFLAANLTRANGAEYLKPFLQVTRKDKNGKALRIAVIGLVGESLKWPPELKAEPAIEIARKWVSKLRKSSDLIIALTHEGHEADRALAAAVPEIDLIVGGHSQSFLQTPVKVNKTLIVETAYQNQYVGVLKLESPLKAEGYQMAALDEFLDPAPGSTSPMQRLVAEFKVASAQAAKAREAELIGEPKANLPAPVSATASAAFQRASKCAECHEKQSRFWNKTKHAKAKASLGRKASAVECEHCHGPGGAHPFSGSYSKTVSDSTCLSCHARDWSGKISQAHRKAVFCPPSEVSK